MRNPYRPPTECALDAARAKITEALAILEGPLADAATIRAIRMDSARAELSAHHPDVIAFAKADARHARIESLVALLRDAQSRTIDGVR